MLDNFYYALLQIFAPIIEFIIRGGPVLWIIACVATVLWWYLLERIVYFRNDHPVIVARYVQRWSERNETNSWNARHIREAMISRINEKLNQTTFIIRTIILLCPLLGLLGTVTGMIDVFDVMAATGGVDTKSMSSSVSRAIIPTMAGMIAAIFGIFGNMYIQRQINQLSVIFEMTLATREDHKS